MAKAKGEKMKVNKKQKEMKRIIRDMQDLQVFTEDERSKFIEQYAKAQYIYEKSHNWGYSIGAVLSSISAIPISILLFKEIGIPPRFSLLPSVIPLCLTIFYPAAHCDKYENYARRIHITADLHRLSVDRGNIEEAKERLGKQYNLATIFRKASFEEFREKYSLDKLVEKWPC